MKKELLNILENETLVALKPSATHGIGVFAIKKIKKGCTTMFTNNNYKWIKLSFEEVKKLPNQSKKLIKNFCLYDSKGYFVPEFGFKIMDLVLYINHSKTPNIISVNDGAYFECIKDISKGDELFLDYNTIV